MERALLVTVNWGKRLDWTSEDEVQELQELVRSCGVAVAGEMVCRRAEANPALLIGKGKIAEIGVAAQSQGAGVIIFNEDLSPAQQRNIEEIVDRKTIDRTQLILDIFAQRARSQEGQLQVELAQLHYLLPRLVGQGVMLSRLGGGIGTRGPGEQKLEVDRRRIRERIARLRNELKELERRRLAARKQRAVIPVPVVALVGYTNAGKTTLLNQLTGAAARAENQLFTTLDPLARRLVLPNHQTVVLTDTVGFLHHLPHDLIEAFHATLEEAREAALLLHVLDVSHQLANEHAEAVYEVLRALHLEDRPVLTVLNKVDLLEDRSRLPRFLRDFAPAVALSAKTREGLYALVEALMAQFDRLMSPQKLFLKPTQMSWLSRIYKEGEVTARRDTPRGIYLEARLPVSLARQLDGLVKKS